MPHRIYPWNGFLFYTGKEAEEYMPKFEIVSLEEALEATKVSRWLEVQFGIELEEIPNPPLFRTYVRPNRIKRLRD